jgi:hypothetical protein
MSHCDGYSPASSNNVFNSFTTTSVSANAKDDLLHIWGDPHVNGVPGPFPASDVIHVGLKQDVWDWSVVSAQVVDHPELLGSELMVIAETKTCDAIVGTYALVGNVPTRLIPEPTTIVLALIGLVGLLGATRNCRRP